MSLRTKLLGAFAILAVIPLLALSAFEYIRSADAVKRLIADQTSALAQRSARQLADRLQVMNGDLQLIADNAETSRLFDSAEIPEPARDRVRAYLNSIWTVVGDNYAWISIRDSADVEIERLGGALSRESDGQPFDSIGPTSRLTVPIRGASSPRTIGTVVGAMRLQRVAPTTLFESTFGHSGFTVLADTTGRIVYDPRRIGWPHGIAELISAERQSRANSDSGLAASAMTLAGRDTTWIAAVVSIPRSPLAIVSASATEEFSRTFAQARVLNLVVALILTATLAVAFILIARRTTRPLEKLAVAADEVGRGNFRPQLPPSGRDEVGRLSESFAAMSAHVDRMMTELEANRQMAAVGSFAGQIAHEIRNPLTSIKLNLQTLERDVRDGIIPADRQRTVEICLQEIQRLDRVVRGILTLGRGSVPAVHKKLACVRKVLTRALTVVRLQLDQQGIVVAYKPPSDDCFVEGDEEQLVGMLLNLFVNAAEAMPTGGCLSVTTSQSADTTGAMMVRIAIADSGPGIPATERSRIFEPFYTTKAQGAGIGLAAAARDAEQHRGHLALLENSEGASGATFVVDLPVARIPNVQ